MLPCSRPQNIGQQLQPEAFHGSPEPLLTLRIFKVYLIGIFQRSWIDPPGSCDTCVHLESIPARIGAIIWERSTELHFSDGKSSNVMSQKMVIISLCIIFHPCSCFFSFFWATFFIGPMVQWSWQICQVPQTTLREQLQEVPQLRTVEVLREVRGHASV